MRRRKGGNKKNEKSNPSRHSFSLPVAVPSISSSQGISCHTPFPAVFLVLCFLFRGPNYFVNDVIFFPSPSHTPHHTVNRSGFRNRRHCNHDHPRGPQEKTGRQWWQDRGVGGQDQEIREQDRESRRTEWRPDGTSRLLEGPGNWAHAAQRYPHFIRYAYHELILCYFPFSSVIFTSTHREETTHSPWRHKAWFQRQCACWSWRHLQLPSSKTLNLMGKLLRRATFPPRIPSNPTRKQSSSNVSSSANCYFAKSLRLPPFM